MKNEARHIRNVFLTAVITVFLSAACLLQSGLNTSADSAPVVAIKAARMIDVRSGAVVQNVVVLVAGGRIQAAGAGIDVPPTAKVVDLGEVTLLPGLVDCHTHLLTTIEYGLPDEVAGMLPLAKMSTAERALQGSVNAREMLMAGFTTVRDLGNAGFEGDIALRNAIRAGWVVGPRMFVSTRALVGVGAQGPQVVPAAQGVFEQEYAVINGAESARLAV